MTQLRHDGGIVARLVRDVLFAALVTAALVTVSEALAAAAGRWLHWGLLFLPSSPDDYGGFVGAAVGAEAGLLALFFATVGVVASVAYARVPAEIRQLFVRERTSLVYVWNVATALLVGLVLLTMPLVAHRQPHGLTVLLFAVLTAFSVLSLAVLGTRLFNFFDLSTLSSPLRARFLRAARAASADGRSVPGEARQGAAHEEAAEVLRIYGQLTDLIETRDVTEGRAAERIAAELLHCWQLSSAIKPAIPTASKWFTLAPSHPNWLTLPHHQLSMSLATATSAPVTLAPDPLWVERIIADCLGRLLRALSTRGDWQRAVHVVEEAGDLTEYLTARLQVDEAHLLRRTVAAYTNSVLSGDRPDTGAAGTGAISEILRLAAADRGVLLYTRSWLGLVMTFAAAHDHQQLAAWFDKAVGTAQGPYRADAPRQLLEIYERLAHGIEFENRTEHQQVTPGWWIHHIAARTFIQILVDAIRGFIQEVRTELISPLASSAGGDASVTVTQILGCLELVHKLAYHLRSAEQAVTVIGTLRHEPTADDRWPETSLPADAPAALEEQLYRKLGQVAPLLDRDPHDSAKPDLFGQSYRQLFNAAFRALLDSHDDLARQLFPAAMGMADNARTRLLTDLASQGSRDQVLFGTEPLMDMMELSGYALLMSELNPPGIWPEVRSLWDTIFAGDTAPAIASHMSAVLGVHKGLAVLVAGGIGRSDRKLALARLMRERGIPSRAAMLGIQPAVPPENPLVAAFAPGAMGTPQADLEDLFIVEYLKNRPDMADLALPPGAERLQESLSRLRQQAQPAATGEEGETQ